MSVRFVAAASVSADGYLAGPGALGRGSGVVNVLGASVTDQLLLAGRLDEIIVNVLPVLLGGGTRFLDPAGPRSALEQLEAHVGDGGNGVSVRYGVRT